MSAARRGARWLVRALAWIGLTGLCLPCSPRSKVERRVSTFITFPADLPVEPQRISFTPPGHVKAARLDRTHVLSLETDGEAFQVRVPEACPTHVPEASPGTALQLEAAPLLDFGPRHLAQVGYDAEIEIRVRPGCQEAQRARIDWRQVEGLPLQQIRSSDQGRTFRVRTLARQHFLPNALPLGIVAISPRTQGRYSFEAVASLPFTAPIRRRITVTSMARATGLSSVAVSQRVLFGESGLSVRSAPRGSRAQVEQSSGAASFMADVAGRYTLADVTGRQLELQALAHDRTPLDCGRAECHANESAAARDTAMSHALQRVSLPRGATPNGSARCALECHVVGEAGLHDGGFVDVSSSLRFADLEHTPVSELPTALRRLAGVGCTSCHGPGAVPPAAARARVLRADVCATCHDAPPRYGHMIAWQRSRMARSDQDVRARRTPACARCHTTGAFLNALGLRRREDLSRDPDDQTVGIACAACHAPHGAHRARALLRDTPAATSLAPTVALNALPSALCTQCHAPLEDETRPSASSAALWLGRVRLPEVLGGGLLEGPAPHSALEGGCMACHGASTDGSRVTTQHTFGVEAKLCTNCHAQSPRSEAALALREQARQLWTELDRACAISAASDGAPRHAAPVESACRGPLRLARARYALALVAEDAAASAHNLPFAERLVEEARAALGSTASGAVPK